MALSNERPPAHGHPASYTQHHTHGPNQQPAEPRTQQLPPLAPATASGYQGLPSQYSASSQPYLSASSHYSTNYNGFQSQPEDQSQYHHSGSFSNYSSGMSTDAHYHHHGLPPQPLPQPYSERPRRSPQALQSFVGQPGFPAVSAHSGERTRFSPEDDEKLKWLKEQGGLSWKQIAEFFPGRVSGTLQVRYCTKLKDKATLPWSRDMDDKLRRSTKEDESGKWSRVAAKLGNGITAQACELRWREVHERHEGGSLPPFDEADATAYDDSY